MELHGRYTFFAEGARGHLTKELKRIFDLEASSQPQVYGIGIKELWDIDPDKHVPGRVIHTQGWPLDDALGRRLPLPPGRTTRSRWASSSRSTTATRISRRSRNSSAGSSIRRSAQFLEGGRRVCYGARAINEGGWQSMPKLAFPGGALIGCSAGFVNVPRIKGSHTAMKSGMLAAEAAFAAIAADRSGDALDDYDDALARQLDRDELKMVRNVEPLVAKFGGTLGTLLAGVDMWMRYLRSACRSR